VPDNAERVGRVRKGRRDGGYTIIRNDLINHPELSVEARCLLIYLLSRPEDWELRVSDVRRFLGAGGKPCGRDKGYQVIAELKRHCFIVMCDDIKGKHFDGVTYYIFESAVTDPEEVRRRHRQGEDALAVPAETSIPENPEAERSSLPDLSYPENPEGIKERYIENNNTPLTPQRRQTRRRHGFGELEQSGTVAQSAIAEPWSKAWTEHRTRTLMRGREQAPAKPSSFIAARIAKGGDEGERERLALQARSCWPTVNAMDNKALQDRVGWRVPVDLFDADLDDRYHSVSVDGPQFAEWQDAHRARGWPAFPVPTSARNVWLPVDGIAALVIPNSDDRVSA
jgi:hypothetical protein